MSRVLARPVDANKCVSADTIASLPLGLRTRLETLVLPAPVALARLIERMIPLGATIEDGEARGRIIVLSRIATGMSLDGLGDEAERFAIWAANHAAREDKADEISRALMDRTGTHAGHDNDRMAPALTPRPIPCQQKKDDN